MSTNYYAKILPNQAEKEVLKLAIDSNKADVVKNLTDMFYRVKDKDHLDRKIIHLGKYSAGWKFLWNTNHFLVNRSYVDSEGDWKTTEMLKQAAYAPDKKSILEYLQQDNLIIIDEYGREVPLSEFILMAFDSNGFDEDSYDKAHPDQYEYKHKVLNMKWHTERKLWEALGKKFATEGSSEFTSDGLRFTIFTEFS
jgi:hypothetical protein